MAEPGRPPSPSARTTSPTWAPDSVEEEDRLGGPNYPDAEQVEAAPRREIARLPRWSSPSGVRAKLAKCASGEAFLLQGEGLWKGGRGEGGRRRKSFFFFEKRRQGDKRRNDRRMLAAGGGKKKEQSMLAAFFFACSCLFCLSIPPRRTRQESVLWAPALIKCKREQGSTDLRRGFRHLYDDGFRRMSRSPSRFFALLATRIDKRRTRETLKTLSFACSLPCRRR